MKILFVLGSFFPAQSGGPNNSVFWIARDLVERSLEVDVVAFKDGLRVEDINEYAITFNRPSDIYGVRVWFFDYLVSRYCSIKLLFWLVWNIRNYSFVNLNSVFFPWSWVCVILCRILNVPFSIAPRGELEPGALAQGCKLKTHYFKWVLSKLFASCRFVWVTSDQELEFCSPFFPNCIVKVIPNFISIKDLRLVQISSREREDVVFLGRLHPKKGVENLINAFVEGLVGSDVRLLIVGSGDKGYVQSLKSLAQTNGLLEDRILFLGHLDVNQKFEVLCRSRALVLPSYSENFGNVVLESLAAGTPVIASVHTPWEVLEERKCGYWCQNDPVNLSEAVNQVFSLDDVEYEAMVGRARRFAQCEYDVAVHGSVVAELMVEGSGCDAG